MPVPAAQPIPIPAAAPPVPVPAAQPVPVKPAPTINVPAVPVPTIKSPEVPVPGAPRVNPIQIQVPKTGTAPAVTPAAGSGTTLTVPPPGSTGTSTNSGITVTPGTTPTIPASPVVPAPKPNLDAPTDVAAAPADALKTSSGLASKVLTVGTGTKKPGPTDSCTVHYSGWTTDGKLFDSSVQRGTPTTFALNRVISGWTEGVQLMVPGEKRRFWIPSAMAYGDNPAPRPGGGAPPPGGNLTFDVELISFVNASTGKMFDANPEPEPVVPSEPAEEDTALPTVREYVFALDEAGKFNKENKLWRTRMPIYKPLTFAKGRKYFWILDTTVGEIRIEFNHKAAPHHVSNFMYLTQAEFFDGLTFHEVVPGFLAKSGCPFSAIDQARAGTGNPGYLIRSEFDGDWQPKMITEDGKEIEAGREYSGTKHDKAGVLSAARYRTATGGESGVNTEGSQFFLTFGPTAWLDNKHTVFGQVVAGLDILKLIEEQGSSRGVPKERLEIRSATLAVE